jgi:hypothetical protein
MALPAQPPAQTDYSIRQGEEGWAVYALQCALPGAERDGSFGAFTDAAVRAVQGSYALVVDGIAGPATQGALADRVCAEHSSGLPRGLIAGIAQGEGGKLLGPVNWSVPGGVDCGLFQRRVYGPPFQLAELQRAFDPGYQAELLRRFLAARAEKYQRPEMASPGPERAWRLAALAHNYPAGADTIAAKGIGGLSAYWRKPQAWVPAVHLPDGYEIRTPLDWVRFYALGWPQAEHAWRGSVTKNVTDWTP